MKKGYKVVVELDERDTEILFGLSEWNRLTYSQVVRLALRSMYMTSQSRPSGTVVPIELEMSPPQKQRRKVVKQ